MSLSNGLEQALAELAAAPAALEDAERRRGNGEPDGWQAATYAGRDAYREMFPGPDGPADTIKEAKINRLTRRACSRGPQSRRRGAPEAERKVQPKPTAARPMNMNNCCQPLAFGCNAMLGRYFRSVKS